ncbi:MAG TPA: hypothetical protein PK156_49590 [Polyangium sp.]|nr:hypothetical protein [Polyangium sp.]
MTRNRRLTAAFVTVGGCFVLQVWLDDARTALDYVRITQGNAESYRASLDGKQQDLFIQASVVQSEIMREKSTDPKEVLEQALVEKAATEIDPLKTEIAIDKQTMGEIQTLVEQSRIDGAPFAAQYATLVDDFVEYRATEAEEMAEHNRNWRKILGHRLPCLLLHRLWRDA